MNPLTIFPPLWHRRAASVTFVATVAGFLVLGYLCVVNGQQTGPLTLIALGLTFTALVLTGFAMLPTPDRLSSLFSFIGYIAAIAGIGVALFLDTSANLHTILVLLLSVLNIIGGIFGVFAWLGLLGLLVPYFYVHLTSGSVTTTSGLIAFVLIYSLPLLASWLLWRSGVRRIAAKSGAHDTTYNTLAEQLNAAMNESDIVINTIADGVLALNNKGEINLINPAAQKALGWSQGDSIGLDFRSIVKLQDAQGNPVSDDQNPIFISLHTNRASETSDTFMVTNSGRPFQARISITPVGAAGTGLIIVFRDITKEKAEEHEQAEFVSTASHEMRTPVAAIEGYLGLALNPQTAAIDEKARLYLTKAHESSQHLGRLFQDLLDVTKADDGRLRNLPMVTDLAQFSSDVVSEFQMKANDKGLTLEFVPGHDSANIERKLTPVYYADFDNDHMREVLGNLLENAIKYTKAGTVRVNVSGDDDSTEVSVTDSGIGIPREDIPHLFQKFYRVDNSDTREIGGTGLGLYLCRRLVELMNGRIWVESEYGKGSTFIVSLQRLGFDDAQTRLQAIREQRERQAANEATKAGITHS
jgi:PAS domain S-box-containing protein